MEINKRKNPLLQYLKQWLEYGIHEDIEYTAEIVSNTITINAYGLSEVKITCYKKRLIVTHNSKRVNWVEPKNYYEMVQLVNFFIIKDVFIDMIKLDHYNDKIYNYLKEFNYNVKYL